MSTPTTPQSQTRTWGEFFSSIISSPSPEAKLDEAKQKLEQVKAECDAKIQEAQKEVDAEISKPLPGQQTVGGRRRKSKTAKKKPSKKRVTKSMFNIKKWNPFK